MQGHNIDQLIETYQLDYSKGLLTSEQLMRLVYRLDRISSSQSRNQGATHE
jgi:hypothetical protein